jgi:hypothetical protein
MKPRRVKYMVHVALETVKGHTHTHTHIVSIKRLKDETPPLALETKNSTFSNKSSHCSPKQAQRVDRVIALPFRDLGTRRGCVVSIKPRPLYHREKPGTQCTGG